MTTVKILFTFSHNGTFYTAREATADGKWPVLQLERQDGEMFDLHGLGAAAIRQAVSDAEAGRG